MTGPSIGHPQIGKLEIAPKLPEGFTYGVMVNDFSYLWHEGGLIAVKPENNSITVWSYHKGSNSYLYPVDNFVLTKVEETAK
ncbi:MAG: hypothetical protein WBQ93_15150 [Candidatus Competibacter sp.]